MQQTPGSSFAKEFNTKFSDLVPWDTKLGHFDSKIQVQNTLIHKVCKVISYLPVVAVKTCLKETSPA